MGIENGGAAAAAGVGVARRRLDDAADAARPAERRPVRRCRIQPVVRPHQRGRLIWFSFWPE